MTEMKAGAITSPSRRGAAGGRKAAPVPYEPKGFSRALQIMFAKSTVARRRPAIELDLSRFRAPGFTYDTTPMDEVARLLDQAPANAEKMRWAHRKDAVLFYAERDLDVPFDDFVSRVDITRVGLMFRDVLGITTEVLAQDEDGRTTLQMERIAALTQPNYAAFLGKDELDVYKLQHMDYSPDEHRNWMRTVYSPNGSAIRDDGYLAFVRTGTGTRLAFMACQLFPMPRMMALLRLDRWTWLKTVLTENAYRRFTNTTFDNIEACYEGREFRVGHPAAAGGGRRPARVPARTPARPRARLVRRTVIVAAALGLAAGAVARPRRAAAVR